MTAVGLDSPASARVRVRVSGLVQGVGFRPFVFSLANRYGLTGWVHNDDAGVLLEIQGDATESFLHALRTELPPLARIDDLGVLRVPGAAGEGSFDIRPSAQTARVSTGIGPDAAPCLACLAECFDPGDRRYRYPFLNCTHCGPRFTITRRLPYDRAQTSMSSFPMCAACESEYHDPHNRRFHAQPTACPACGPRLTMPVEEVVRRLRRGEVVALKGLGGFHIACDATNHDAVARLRRDKQRDGKPFALLVAGLPTARTLVELDSLEAGLLQSNRAPDRGRAPSGRRGTARARRRARPLLARSDAALIAAALPPVSRGGRASSERRVARRASGSGARHDVREPRRRAARDGRRRGSPPTRGHLRRDRRPRIGPSSSGATTR